MTLTNDCGNCDHPYEEVHYYRGGQEVKWVCPYNKPEFPNAKQCSVYEAKPYRKPHGGFNGHTD